jgi:hypothetical protein
MFAYLKCKRLVAYTHSKYACRPPGLISLDESTHELGEQIIYHSPNRPVVLLQTTTGINKLNAFQRSTCKDSATKSTETLPPQLRRIHPHKN